jgi:channel protein (hemolysin III family)
VTLYLNALKDNESETSTIQSVDYLLTAANTIVDKAKSWTQSVSDQIDKYGNGTIGDWLVLKPVLTDPLKEPYFVSRVPLFIFIASAIACLGLSTTYHLFKDHSKDLNEFLVRFDYAGISLMIAGCNISPLYYSFYCEPLYHWRRLYIWGITISSSLVFATSLWPKFDKPKFRPLRGTLFVILGLLGVVPFLHIIYFM